MVWFQRGPDLRGRQCGGGGAELSINRWADSAASTNSGGTKTDMSKSGPSSTPTVSEMRVVPVAGRDSMLLNLSGAHGPYFTRNVLILKDNDGRTGVGEVPGGPAIARTLEESREFVIGK